MNYTRFMLFVRDWLAHVVSHRRVKIFKRCRNAHMDPECHKNKSTSLACFVCLFLSCTTIFAFIVTIVWIKLGTSNISAIADGPVIVVLMVLLLQMQDLWIYVNGTGRWGLPYWWGYWMNPKPYCSIVEQTWSRTHLFHRTMGREL